MGTKGALTVTGLAVLLSLAIAASASASVLYDQTAGPTTGSVTSSNFGVANKVAQGADDFTVPPGSSWQIASVHAVGSGALGSSATAAVFLYANVGSHPGISIFSQQGIPISGINNLTIPITGSPVLQPGTYWISVQITDPAQWSWAIEVAQFGSVAAWQNPGDGFGTGCTAYAPLTTCLATSSKSFMFRLDAADPVPPASPAPAAAPTSAPAPVLAKKKCKKRKRAAVSGKRKCRKRKR